MPVRSSSELRASGAFPTAAEAESARTLSMAAVGAAAAGRAALASRPKSCGGHQGSHRIPVGKAKAGVLRALLGGSRHRLLRSIHFTTWLGPQRAGVTGEVGAFLGRAPTLGPHLFTQPFTHVSNAYLCRIPGERHLPVEGQREHPGVSQTLRWFGMTDPPQSPVGFSQKLSVCPKNPHVCPGPAAMESPSSSDFLKETHQDETSGVKRGSATQRKCHGHRVPPGVTL